MLFNRVVLKKIYIIFELYFVFGYDSVLWCGILIVWFFEGWLFVG